MYKLCIYLHVEYMYRSEKNKNKIKTPINRIKQIISSLLRK